MTSDDSQYVIGQFLKKMGLHDEPHMLQKTTELLRLLELRSSNMPKQLFVYGKVLICADIAAAQLDVPFDKEHAMKLGAMSKSQYNNHKRTFEKLLGVNKVLGISDICVKLNLNEVQQKATELLELYRRVVLSENNEVDMSHPQYAAMAIFYACKLTKRTSNKTKLMPFSNLKPTQWLQLEQRWERIISQHYNSAMDCKLITKGKPLNEMEAIEVERQKLLHEKQQAANKLRKAAPEDYETWKQRILLKAHAQLKAMNSEETNTKEHNVAAVKETNDKENTLLGM